MSDIDRIRKLAGLAAQDVADHQYDESKTTQDGSGPWYKEQRAKEAYEKANPGKRWSDLPYGYKEDWRSKTESVDREMKELSEEPNEGNEFTGELEKARKAGKKEFEVDGKKYKVKESAVCEVCGEDPCICEACNEEAEEEIEESLEEITEAPTMDTTQLVTLLKNAGLSEEVIQRKLAEWANTPEGVGEIEPTEHGDAYDFAQSVNLSLKRYLDAQDMKVQVSEHTVEGMKALYEAKKKSK